MHSLCGFNIFLVCGCFDFDVCCLFPQRVRAAIPLMGVCRCVARTYSQGGGDSGWCPVVGPSTAAAVRTHLWSLRWQWQVMPAPGALAGGALPPASTCLEKEAPVVVPPLSSWAPQMHLASLAGPGFFPDSLGCGAPHPSPLGCLHTANPSSPWV